MEHTLAEKEDILLHLPLFAVLRDEERSLLASQGRILALRKGERLFHEGDVCTGLYVVLTGLFKMSRHTRDGKEMVLHLIRPENTLGEGSVFKRGDVAYPATATAAEDSSALFLPAGLVLELVRGNAEFAVSMLSTLATRLYMFTRKLEAHNMREAPQRLAAYLLHRHRLRGQGDTVLLDVSRETLASTLGTARETVSRTLSRLIDCGAIAVRGREVRILNKDILHSIAEGQD